ncbi:MAG: serine hydrolase [Bacillota bacterium]|nr:serine hydrolase [Bacillota bacterium]
MKKTRQNPTQRTRADRNVKNYSINQNGRAARPNKRRGHNNQTGWLIAGIAFILIFAAVWLVRPLLQSRQTDPTGESSQTTATTSGATTSLTSGTTTSGQTTTTETTTESTPSLPETLSDQERQAILSAAGGLVIERLEQVSSGRFGIYFQNLAGGEIWSYQDEEPFVAASSIKLGINTCLYTRIAAGEISPDDLLTYDNRAYPTGDFEAGTGTIQNLPNGSKLTVRETSGLSIRISDNCGTNMVIRKLGGIDAINPWLNEISGSVDYRVKVSYTNYGGQSQNGRHRTCARDLGLQAAHLYALWQEAPAVYDPLIEDLSNTQFDFGIQKGIPTTIQVAHKIGTNGAYSAENDVGIVMTEEPFVLCIMTEMASSTQARQIQADIAAIFYEAVSGWPLD